MFLDWLLLAVSFALQFILIPKPQDAKAASLSDFNLPVCEEGKEFGVLSGTEILKGPNVTWWGDLKVVGIDGPRRYGFFGPRSTIGHKYSLGIQMTLCQGPADSLKEIWVGDKLIWRGVCTGGIININKPGIFGGESSEGGIVGQVEVCMGEPDQAQNTYLAQTKILGPECPAFRGVVTIVLRQVYLGTTPYIKPWAFKVQRIHKKSDNTTQWYDAKAAVPDSFGNTSTETGDLITNNTAMSFHGIETRDNWAAITGSGTLAYVWNLDDPATVQSFTYTPAGSGSLDGLCYITTDDELITCRGGNPFGSLPTFLDFRVLGGDLTNPAYSIPLSSYFVYPEFNSGITAAEYDDNSGDKHIFALVGPYGPTVTSRGPYILLKKAPGTDWSVDDFGQSDGTTIGAYSGVDMGPTYAYLFDQGQPDVGLVKWSDGSFTETKVTLTAFGSLFTALGTYYKQNNEVIFIARDTLVQAEMFVFDETCTVLKRHAVISSDQAVAQALSSFGRIMSGNIFFVPYTDGSGKITKVRLVNVDTMLVVDTVDIAGSQLVQKDANGLYFQVNASSGSAFVAPNTWAGSQEKGAMWPLYPPSLDMNPAHMIREYLTDPVWAMGYNVSDIDDDAFTYAADLFFNENFGLTIYWVKEEEVQQIITIILGHIDAVLYVSRTTGKFILKPIRSDYVLEDLPNFTDDDVVAYSEVKRTQPADAVTSITVKYTERRKDISKDGSATFHNDAAIQQADGIILASKDYPGISRHDLAARVAERDQHTFNPGIISGSINGTRRWQILNPGSAFRFTSAKHNLNGEVMRVLDMKFYAGQDNKIGIQFLQDLFRLGATALVDLSDTKWVRPGNNALPVDPRLVWEMPYFELLKMIGPADTSTALLGDPNFGMIEVAGEQPTPDTLDVTIYTDSVKTDILSFFSPSGFLTGDITSLDTTIVISDATVFTSLTVGMLAAIVETDPAHLEIIRIDAKSGNILTVSRGMLDTVPRPHLAGTDFIAYDDFTMSDFVGRTDGDMPSVRLISRTPLGSLPFSSAPADVVDMSHRAIRPYRPANVTVNGDAEGPLVYNLTADLTVDWVNRNRLTESVPLAWTDADVTPETGQTAIIEILDPDRTTVHTTHSGLTGTTYNVPVADFSGTGGWVRVGAERDSFREWQAYEIQVLFTLLGTGTFILTGNPANLTVAYPLAAGTGAFTLTGNPVALNTTMPVATGVFTLSGPDAGLVFSAGLVAATGAYILTGIDVSLTFAAGERDTLLPGGAINMTSSRDTLRPKGSINF